MSARLPLEGVRIIDMTLAWVGPFGTQLLADWGAEVIRVEPISIFQYGTRATGILPADRGLYDWASSYPDSKSPANATGTETRFSRFTAATSSA